MGSTQQIVISSIKSGASAIKQVRTECVDHFVVKERGMGMVLVGKGTWKVRNWEGEWEIKINVWKRLTFPNKNLFQGTFQWHFRENFQLLGI